jgi:hypothetical protein
MRHLNPTAVIPILLGETKGGTALIKVTAVLLSKTFFSFPIVVLKIHYYWFQPIDFGS